MKNSYPNEKHVLVKFDNVGIRYNSLEKEILKNISLDIHEGDFLFLIGESGSGKSTFLNMINSSLKPTRGYLNIFGHDISSVSTQFISKIRQKIGIIFQDYRLINHLSVFDNIAIPLKILNQPHEEIEHKVYALLDWINLKKYAHNMPYTLSGGEQQRIAIARAVIHKPDIILADEPTGSVDPEMAKKILLMLEYMNKQNVAVVFATHNLELVEEKNHPILLLDNHKLHKLHKDK